MRKILTLLTLTLTLAIPGIAQTKTGKISGHVIDGNVKTIESATITLLRSKDSSVIKLSVANKEGNFVFENVGDGKYLVSVTAVGHTKGFSEIFEINDANNSVKLKTIELVPQAKSMGEVTVTAKKPLIEQNNGRWIKELGDNFDSIGVLLLTGLPLTGLILGLGSYALIRFGWYWWVVIKWNIRHKKFFSFFVKKS